MRTALSRKESLRIALDHVAKFPSHKLLAIMSGGKTPLTKYTEATDDPEKLKALAKRFPSCNWAVLLKPSGLICVDVDVKEAAKGQETFDDLDLMFGFPASLLVRTPSGGFHLYLRGASLFALGKSGLGAGIDLPHYVLIAGCKTDAGTYRVENDIPIAAAPSWIYEKVKPRERVENAREAVIDLDQPMNIQRFEDYLENEAPPCLEENNDGELTMFNVAAVARDMGLSEQRTFAVILPSRYNEEKCVPPWGADDLEKKIANAFDYASLEQPGGASAESELGNEKLDPPPPTQWKTVDGLMAKTFAPVSYVVPSYIANGLTLLVARPKFGKSWWVIDAAISVATGGEFFGEKVDQGDVLLLALEDNERRLKSRFAKLTRGRNLDLSRLTYETEWPRTNEGGLEKIEEWIKSWPNARLIVIDVLARVRPLQVGKAPQYDRDYLAISAIQAIASKHDIAIILVHHTRKGASDSGDFVDSVSGTLGLVGAADAVAEMRRDAKGATFQVKGRDVADIEVAIEFDAGRCQWGVLEKAAEVRVSAERKQVLNVLLNATDPMSAAMLADETDMKPAAVRKLLSRMMKDGEIERKGKGYVIRESGDDSGPIDGLNADLLKNEPPSRSLQ